MTGLVALAPTFTKGVLATIAAFVLFIGSVYVLTSAIFGRRMGLAVLSTAFFSWMIILSLLWVAGVPGSNPRNLGPRGTEAHWQVFAAGAGAQKTQYPVTGQYPDHWRNPTTCPPPTGEIVSTEPSACHNTASSVQAVVPAIQTYLAAQAQAQLASQGQNVTIDPTTFSVTNVQFSESGSTFLAVGRGFDASGGPAVTVFVYHDKGNVPVYSWGFLLASALGFAISVPFLDRAERSRKAILTGGTAPPWYGPA
ncbi:MAG TPA: hypothetical protein VGH10_03100 [Actinomycetota bacterium]|jgi:hypothetical protein